MADKQTDDRIKVLEQFKSEILKIMELSERANPDGSEYIPISLPDGSEYRMASSSFFNMNLISNDDADFTLTAGSRNNIIEMVGNDHTFTIPNDLAWFNGARCFVIQQGTGLSFAYGGSVTHNEPQALTDEQYSIYLIIKRAENDFNIVQLGAASGGGGGATNLSIGTNDTTTVEVVSDTGTNAVIPSVTSTTAGLQRASTVDVIFTDYLNLDATGVTDCAATIQTAIDASTGDYLSIFGGQGKFKLESQINIFDKYERILMRGNNTVFAPTFDDDIDAFRIGGASGTTNEIYPESVIIENIDFDLSGCVSTSAVSALNIDTVLGSCNVTDCDFFGFTNYTTTGIEMLNIGNNPDLLKNNSEPGFKIDRCNFYNVSLVDATSYNYNSHNTRGIGVVIGATDDDASEYWNISNCHFSNVYKGTIIKSGANGIIFNCHYQYCNPIEEGTSGIEHGIVEIDGSSDNDGKLTLSSCKFNHNWGTSIFSSYTNDDRPVLVLDSQFLVNAYLPIKVNNSDRFKVHGNTFDRPKHGIGSNKPTFTLNRYIVILSSNACSIQMNDFVSAADYGVAFSGTSKDNIVANNTYDNSVTNLSTLTNGVLNNTVVNNVQTT